MDSRERRKIFGKRLKELRKEKGCTQQMIATLFHISRPCVCAWETGQRMPDYTLLVGLSDFFCVSMDYLLGRTDIRDRKLSASDQAVYHLMANALSLDTLTPENQAQLIQLYEYLKENQTR